MPAHAVQIEQGVRFQHWTVLDVASATVGRHKASLCKCDCGITRLVKNTSLVRGRSKSCGHVSRLDRCASSRKKLPTGLAARNAAAYHIRKSASRRGWEFQLSDDEVFSLMTQPCYWCGREAVNVSKAKSYNGEFRYNGIDRLDNEKGYVDGNVVSCCGPCNRSKNTMSKNEFVEFCVMVAMKFGGCEKRRA